MNKKEMIIKALENAGYKHRKDFTVSVTYPGYETSYHIKVRNVNISLKAVEKIARGFESVDYDERCMEILAGGNDYVWVKYAESKNELFNNSGKKDYSVYFSNILEEYAYKNYLEKAKEMMAKIDPEKDFNDNRLLKVYKDELVSVYAFKDGCRNRLDVSFVGNPNHRFESYSLDVRSLSIILAKIDLGHYGQTFTEKTLFGYLKLCKASDEYFDKKRYAKHILENIEYNKKYPDYGSFRYICFDSGFVDLNHLSLSDIGNLQKLAQI